MIIALVVSVLLCLPFMLIDWPPHDEAILYPSQAASQATMRLLKRVSPTQVSVPVGISTDHVVAVLEQAGFPTASPDSRLASIAWFAGKDDDAIFASLAALAP